MISNSGKPGTIVSSITAMLQDLLSPKQFISWKFWLFTYLVLCVGSHMAPSTSDYEGASRGVWMVVFALVACVLVVSLLGVETDRAVQSILRFLSPVFGLQLIAIVICCFATTVVHVLTSFFPERFAVS